MTNNKENKHAILLMHCSDKKGLVASVTEFLDKNNGNIVDLDEHVDHENGTFFMRTEWELENFTIPREKIGEQFNTLIGEPHGMRWNLYFSDQVPRMAIFVSKMPHCLYDILARYAAGECQVEIPLIISNHEDLKPVAQQFGIPFHVIPVNKDNKPEKEKLQMELLEENNIDFVVLARYMQILSPDFTKQYPNRIINIHHSFLPAFPGAKPYHSAWERGVKIIGATSHYTTSELDGGPIIEQDIARTDHKDDVKTLVRKGRDIEKIVLSRAIFNHLQRKLLVYKNRTIVFN